jgi:hypothetical protein
MKVFSPVRSIHLPVEKRAALAGPKYPKKGKMSSPTP